jgi:hypothetical protein
MMHKIVKNPEQQLLIYGRDFIQNIMLQLLYCVWAIPVYAFFQVSPYNEMANEKAMGYPIHEMLFVAL